MKKIVLALVAVFTMTGAFADNSDTKTNEKTVDATVPAANLDYDMSVNYHMLGGTLCLDHSQIERFVAVHDKFVGEVKDAGNASVSTRSNLVRKAAHEELNEMRQILDDGQYRKFNMLLNLTLVNRGLLR